MEGGGGNSDSVNSHGVEALRFVLRQGGIRVQVGNVVVMRAWVGRQLSLVHAEHAEPRKVSVLALRPRARGEVGRPGAHEVEHGAALWEPLRVERLQSPPAATRGGVGQAIST